MKFAEWKEVAELIGLIAIIASLIFVGLQLKQSQEIALANQYQARAEAVQQLHLTHMEVGRVPAVPAFREQIAAGVSTVDINTNLWLWIQMDNHHYQYQHGFLDEEAWQAQLSNTRALYEDCRMRFVYDWRKRGLRKSFVEMVESVDDPCAG